MRLCTMRSAALFRTAGLSLLSLVLYSTLKIFIASNAPSPDISETKYDDSQLLVNGARLNGIERNDDPVQDVRSQNDGIIQNVDKQTKKEEKDDDASQQRIQRDIPENKKPLIPIARDVPCDSQHLHHVPKIVQDKCTSKSCRNVTCYNLLYSSVDNPVFNLAKKWMEQHKPTFLESHQLEYQLRNCEAFKRDKGYHLEALSKEEANFPIAYNIIMHKDISQIEKLLRVIYRPQNIYCIHVDAKAAESLIGAVRALANCFPNVFVASKLERIVYAGVSRLQADINCMKDLVQKKHSWRYLINLAGQATPLKSNVELVKILKIYNGSNDIEGIIGPRIHKSRFENEWLETRVNTSNPIIVKTLGKRNPPPPDDIEIVRGSAYGVFSRKFVEFLLTDKKAQHLLEWSRKTYSPDEHYWATLHHTYSNPHIKAPGSYSGIPNEKAWLAVFVAWGGVDKCHGMWKRGTCVFGVADLPMLVSKREMFANKFYENHQPFALECLNEWIEYKSTCPGAVPFDSSYYQSLPFIKKG